MAVGIGLVNKVKASVRMSTNNQVIVDDIKDYLEACKKDLAEVGVKRISENDPMIIDAAKEYVKWKLDYNGKGEVHRDIYNSIKTSLSLYGSYNTEVTARDLRIGQKVIVEGTVYLKPDDTRKSITKSGDDMYVAEILDETKYKYCIGLAQKTGEEIEGYAEPRILSPE